MDVILPVEYISLADFQREADSVYSVASYFVFPKLSFSFLNFVLRLIARKLIVNSIKCVQESTATRP
jgi:hypothetical protein